MPQERPAGGSAAAAARTKAQEAALSVSLQKFKRGKKARRRGRSSRRAFRLTRAARSQVDTSSLKDKKLRGELNAAEKLARNAALSAAKARRRRSGQPLHCFALR